jgi:hypothetical protein
MKRALLVLLAAVIATLAFAGTASASTPGCTSGALYGYCGTQATDTTPALVMDSSGQRATYGNPVIGWTNSTTDPATDFFQLAYAGDNMLGVMFMYAPGGAISGMCVADPGDGHVVLRTCNGGNWQRWIPAEISSSGYYTWTNRATHQILTANGKGGQLMTVTPQTGAPSQYAAWKFTG